MTCHNGDVQLLFVAQIQLASVSFHICHTLPRFHLIAFQRIKMNNTNYIVCAHFGRKCAKTQRHFNNFFTVKCTLNLQVDTFFSCQTERRFYGFELVCMPLNGGIMAIALMRKMCITSIKQK